MNLDFQWWKEHKTAYIQIVELNKQNIFFIKLAGLRLFQWTFTNPCSRPLKGLVSRDWEWLRWIPSVGQKNVGLPEHIFITFWHHFYVLILKKNALAVSHLTVTLQMMSNNRRSFSSNNSQMKNLNVTLLAGWSPPYFWTFFNRSYTLQSQDPAACELHFCRYSLSLIYTFCLRTLQVSIILIHPNDSVSECWITQQISEWQLKEWQIT